MSVVLWVQVADIRILLGSDLENLHQPDVGWSVIVESRNRPPSKASVFKVPHHGSVSAYNPRVWSDMLEVEPHAILTPFIKGDIVLPTKQDAGRILSHTPKAYITNTTRRKRPRRRSNTVRKTIREMVRTIYQVGTQAGHVRLRKPAGDPGEWKVELFNGAASLAH
jgi:hypothetical protein